MARIFGGVIVVLLVVSLVFRKFFYGAICVLGVAGSLIYIYQQHATQEKREWQARAATRDALPGATKEAAASWEKRYGKSGTQAALTFQERSEAVSTPEEAAQAVQRLRAAQDLRQQGQGEQPALTVPQVDLRQQSAGNDSSELTGTTTVLASPDASATVTPRVIPIPRVTVIPPSSISPRATLSPPADPMPPAVPTASATPPASVTPTASAPTGSHTLKSCDELKAEIQAKLEAKSLTGYALIIVTSGDMQGLNVVGSCEGNTKKIVLNRWRNAP